MSRPHVLILMTDQQRADSLGCAGHPILKTRNIDRIALEGTRFTQATTASPLCMPARASFATSRFPHNHGMWKNAGKLSEGEETLFQVLQRAGYYTAQVGKTHFYEHAAGTDLRSREAYLHGRGLEFVHETAGPHATTHTLSYLTEEWSKKGVLETFIEDYRVRAADGSGGVWASPLSVDDFLDSYIGRKAVDFVDGYRDHRPMCLFVGFGGPHDPYDAPGPYARMYRPEDTLTPAPIPKAHSSLPQEVMAKKDFQISPPSILEAVPRIRANYYGKISLIDDNIGHILNAFQRRGWLDDLFIVFLSDHGEMLGDHGRLRKSTFHESSVRIPLIARWPGRIPQNNVSEALAEIVDVFPTVVEACGAEPSARCLGRSLWPVFGQPNGEVKDCQVSEVVAFGEARLMLRSRQWKLAIDAQNVAYMLYDLQSDPQEQRNLVMDPAAKPLLLQLRRHLASTLGQLQWSAGVG